MRALIAGAGYVGDALARALVARGDEVVVLRRSATPPPPGACAFRADLAAPGALDALPPMAAILAFGVVAAAVVAACVREDADLVARIFGAGPLRALGRVSYSFYLVHWMIVVLVARAVAHAQPFAATAVIFAGGFALSAIAAAALWWIAERPYFAWVNARRR